MLLNIPGLFLAVSLVCYCGLVMYASFASCDPLKSKEISYSDEVIYIVKIFLSLRSSLLGHVIFTAYALLCDENFKRIAWYSRPIRCLFV